MSASLELRNQLIGAIADVIADSGQQYQDIAVTVGLDKAEVSRLANRRVEDFSAERLANYCPMFGLALRMHVHGQTEQSVAPTASTRLYTKPISEPDYTESGRLVRQLGYAISDEIAASPLKQADLAEQKGLPRPTISTLKNRRLDTFKLDRLIDYAPKFGLTVDISVTPAAQLA